MKKWALFLAGLAMLGAVCSCAKQSNHTMGAGGGGGKIAGGPFVVHVTRRTATVAWIVESDEVTAHAAGAPALTAGSLTAPVLRVEKTTLANLQPNTRYEYDIAAGVEAGKGSFKTAPSKPGPYQFMVYGDNRTRHDVHARVVGEMLKHGTPDFLIQTGDMVANGSDSALWPIFFGIEKELLRQTAFFPTPGNHERGARAYYDYFDQSGPYYSFDWGNSHFSVLNSDIGSVPGGAAARDAFWAEEVRWLEADLKAHQDADFRFVVAHHPPITAVSDRQGDNLHMIALIPMLEEYHVAAGFFGHDHNYQHYLKGGIHYMVTGGGGAPLYDVDVPPEGITQKVASIENFVTVKVDGPVAHVQAIDINGQPLDDFEIHGSKQKPARGSETRSATDRR